MPEPKPTHQPSAADVVKGVLTGKPPKINLPEFDVVTMRAAMGIKTYSDVHNNKLTSHWWDKGYDVKCGNGAKVSDGNVVNAVIRAIERGVHGESNNPSISTFSFEGTNPLVTMCKTAKTRQMP
ncbi:MAG: hypothetical protein K2X09_02335 [Rickettsiales bacterium]|nr:hypothetical protein [Rickettsiales bacterium]